MTEPDHVPVIARELLPGTPTGWPGDGRPIPINRRTVTLVSDPGDHFHGLDIDVVNDWVYLAYLNGGVVVMDPAAPGADEDLEQVGRGGWTYFEEDPQDPSIFRAGPPR